MVTAILRVSPGNISKKRRQNKLNQLESCSSFTVLCRNWVQAIQKNEFDKSPPACHLPPSHCSCRCSSCAADANLSGWPQDTKTPSTANMHTIFFKLRPYVKFFPIKCRALMLQHCLLVHKDCYVKHFLTLKGGSVFSLCGTWSRVPSVLLLFKLDVMSGTLLKSAFEIKHINRFEGYKTETGKVSALTCQHFQCLVQLQQQERITESIRLEKTSETTESNLWPPGH